jgi:hypothetical protein
MLDFYPKNDVDRLKFFYFGRELKDSTVLSGKTIEQIEILNIF